MLLWLAPLFKLLFPFKDTAVDDDDNCNFLRFLMDLPPPEEEETPLPTLLTAATEVEVVDEEVVPKKNNTKKLDDRIY